MEELNNLSKNLINEIQNTKTKNIIIETKEFLTPQERMAMDTIRRVEFIYKRYY